MFMLMYIYNFFEGGEKMNFIIDFILYSIFNVLGILIGTYVFVNIKGSFQHFAKRGMLKTCLTIVNAIIVFIVSYVIMNNYFANNILAYYIGLVMSLISTLQIKRIY